MKLYSHINILFSFLLKKQTRVLFFPGFFFFSLISPASEVILTKQGQAWMKNHPILRASNEPDSIPFTKEEKTYLKRKKVIKMCIDPDWMPFESFDKKGRHIGMTKAYFDLFKQRIGILITAIRTKSWTESIRQAKARNCDIYSLAMATEERKKYMNFTSPYLSIPLILATRMNVAFMDDMKYLKKEKIGIVKGYAFNEIIRKKYPNIDVVDVENIHDGLQRVVNQELFGFIGTIASVGYELQREFIGELKIAGKFSDKWELGIGVRNDEPLLLGIFEKAVQSLSAETKQAILNKYITIKYEPKPDYSLLFKVLIAVLIVGLFVAYHYRKLTLINKKLEQLQKTLRQQANHDHLTGLYNRRYFQSVANNIISIAKREHQSVSVIMIDIDFFKKVNDTYGHAIGDMVIKRLAQLMRENTRKSDIVARLGGEEFAILLPNTDVEGAHRIAEKLRGIVEKERITNEQGTTFSFTISLGISAIFSSDNNIDKALNRADKALYHAKESGRNQVAIYQGEITS